MAAVRKKRISNVRHKFPAFRSTSKELTPEVILDYIKRFEKLNYLKSGTKYLIRGKELTA